MGNKEPNMVPGNENRDAAVVKEKVPRLPVRKIRLASLDALRGFDMFLLCGFAGFFGALVAGPLDQIFSENQTWRKVSDLLVYQVCTHSDWTGFTLHDLIMPLFMFMTGVTIPFSMAKYKKSESNPSPAYGWLVLRILRRVILLWIFGMMVQGNLLALKWEGLRFYSNTLQAIAAGYLIAVIAFFFTKKIGQTIIAVVLCLIFWGIMTWASVTDAAGDVFGRTFAEWENMAEWIDRAVLGRWMDGATLNDGVVEFSPNYHYTWILSSLTFGATTISGLLAGGIIKSHLDSENGEKPGHLVALLLMGIGILIGALGWGWGMVPQGHFGYCPLIKHLWTPSMVLYASGLSFLLLGLFYEIYDVLHLPLCKTFFVVIGMNAITAYLIHSLWGNFGNDVSSIIFGLEHHIGSWYKPLYELLTFALLWFVLWCLYRKKIFIRL